jgi:hypothetical protein
MFFCDMLILYLFYKNITYKRRRKVTFRTRVKPSKEYRKAVMKQKLFGRSKQFVKVHAKSRNFIAGNDVLS